MRFRTRVACLARSSIEISSTDTEAGASGLSSARGGVSRMTEARLGSTALFLLMAVGEEDDTELREGRRGLIDEADEAELADADADADGDSARSWMLFKDDADADTFAAELRSAYNELTLGGSLLFVEADERKEDMGTVVAMDGRSGDFDSPLKSSAGSLSAGSPSMCKSG